MSLPSIDNTPPGYEEMPDIRDGLNRRERIVLYLLHETQTERDDRNVPTAMLWGRVPVSAGTSPRSSLSESSLRSVPCRRTLAMSSLYGAWKSDNREGIRGKYLDTTLPCTNVLHDLSLTITTYEESLHDHHLGGRSQSCVYGRLLET